MLRGNVSSTGGKAEDAIVKRLVGFQVNNAAAVLAGTCVAEREKVREGAAAFFSAGNSFDLLGTASKEVSFDGKVAIVMVAGAKVVVGGKSTDVPPFFGKVLEEEGNWVWCGDAEAPKIAPAEAPASGAVTADVGFRPAQNGFAFQNYGNDIAGSPAVNLTAQEVRRMFGDGVCASIDGNVCTLTPAGMHWAESMNKSMGGGHCEGMAVVSSLMHAGKLEATDFGGQTGAFELKVIGNEKLQREIAYWFATQIKPGLERKDMKPAEVADEIKAQLAKGKTGEYYVLGIYQPGYKQGHAITPFAIKEDGDIIRILIYDNNFPGQERYLTVDRKSNQWTYNTASNPAEPASDYKGDADTFTLTLAPISSRIPVQACPFCAASATGDATVKGSAAAAGQYNQIILTGDANLLITDGSGKRLGYVAGKLINEIPGALFQPVKSAATYLDEGEPVYYIPRGVKFNVTLDGSGLKKPAESTVTMIGPGYVLEVDNVTLEPGQKDTILFSQDGTELTYVTTGKETPELVIGVETAGADYEFDVKAAGETNGQQITLKLDAKAGNLAIGTKDLGGSTTYALVVSRYEKGGVQSFEAEGLELSPTATDYIQYGEWVGNKKPLKIGIDENNDGKIDTTITVDDAK